MVRERLGRDELGVVEAGAGLGDGAGGEDAVPEAEPEVDGGDAPALDL